ncbi:DNA-processing protein DprA [Clostridium swellfunianum]|uniref:DNA-processing protein DprA n=1 Tax=Clostridium swellfunianum TaxID=1367462 RepID=UPI002030E3E9|nr:DNA-processing protein DprA [Clostridium swellfunianum]MCM0648599.1 DNA-processing protein DprA [Clostridium swellfunianum]
MIEYEIWFSMLKLSNRIKLELIKKYGTPENIRIQYLNGSISDEALKKLFQDSWNEKEISIMLERILSNNIGVVCFNSTLYPKKLQFYDDAPSILFYKGDISKLNTTVGISIVGSRRCTSYGINATKIISEELSKNKISIISGMAKGIDTCAHITCLNNGGYTCAVLGSGLDVIYPKENKSLYDKIVDAGCVVSEYLPGTQPAAYNFPVRNRIISELSSLVIVVEAGIKSGSLITASFAAEQGIDVMALPGSIFSEQSKGCNKLIKDGAYPLTSIEDIFNLLDMSHDNFMDKESVNFNGYEHKVYGTLSDSPIHIDDIIKLTNIDINYLYEVLFELQLKDEIMCLAGNYYVKNIKKI